MPNYCPSLFFRFLRLLRRMESLNRLLHLTILQPLLALGHFSKGLTELQLIKGAALLPSRKHPFPKKPQSNREQVARNAEIAFRAVPDSFDENRPPPVVKRHGPKPISCGAVLFHWVIGNSPD